MSTRLILVRHAQVDANVDLRWNGSIDTGLTAHGLEEARKVAAYVARTYPKALMVYSSPAERARSTATPIAAALGVPLVVAPGLAEYAIGVLEGELFSDLLTQHRFFEQAEADLTWAPANGESLGAVGERVLGVLRQIARDHPNSQIVVVSHGAAIAIGLAMLLHENPRGWPRYALRNASVTEVELGDSPQLVTLGAVEHLE
jgi:broad specificity phosphatase PhoE